jgi:tetratricopeptide (TPR) repeat protein
MKCYRKARLLRKFANDVLFIFEPLPPAIFYRVKYDLEVMLKAVSRYIPLALVFLALFFLVSPALAQDEEEQKDPVKLFQQGQDAHEKGEWQKALDLYDQALELAPEFPEAEYQKGNALVSLNRPAEAETAFRRALELRPDWTPPMSSLGALLVRTGKFVEAEKLLQQAIRMDEQNFPAYAALTELYLKTKASPQTLKTLLARLQALTAKMRPPVSMWVARAAVERALGDTAAARASAERGLAIDPKNIPAQQERGEAALALGDSTAALNDADNILKTAPAFLNAKLLRARAQAAAGNTDEALKTLDTVEEGSRQTIEYKAVLQAVSAAKSDSVDNMAELEKLLAADAKNVPVLARLCVAARKTDPAKALDYCRRAAELEPNNMNHVVGYGAALVQSRQFDSAVMLLRKVTAAAPDNFTAHANLATALIELKRYPEAAVEYEWLVEKKPDLAIGYFFLGIAYDNSQKYVEAMGNYKKFLTLADPSYNKEQIDSVNLRLPAVAKQIEKLKKK